jgi:hypothetical protein
MAMLIDGSVRCLEVVSALRVLEVQLRTVPYNGNEDTVIAAELDPDYDTDVPSYEIFKASPVHSIAAQIYKRWYALASPNVNLAYDDDTFEKYGSTDTLLHNVLAIMIPEIFPKTHGYMTNKAIAIEFGQLELPL